MRIIYPNLATPYSASTTKEGHNISFATNPVKALIWQPEDSDTNPSLTLTVSGKANSLLIAGCYAYAVNVVIRSGATIVSEYTIQLSQSDDYNGDYQITKFWIDYPEITTEHTITIGFTRGSLSDIGVGMVFAGYTGKPYNDPDYGASGGLKDYSIEWEIDTGHGSSFPGAIKDNRSFTIDFANDSDQFNAFLRKMKETGIQPCAFLILEENESEFWTLYGKIIRDSIAYSLQSYSELTISFSIDEVL